MSHYCVRFKLLGLACDTLWIQVVVPLRKLKFPSRRSTSSQVWNQRVKHQNHLQRPTSRAIQILGLACVIWLNVAVGACSANAHSNVLFVCSATRLPTHSFVRSRKSALPSGSQRPCLFLRAYKNVRLLCLFLQMQVLIIASCKRWIFVPCSSCVTARTLIATP